MQSNNNPIQAVLFDLDGTLLDTENDLLKALNTLRRSHQLDNLAPHIFRSVVNRGSKAMVKIGFDIEETNEGFAQLRNDFLALYEQHIIDSTNFFPQMENLLTHLEKRSIPWGIVTNKLTKHTLEILKRLNIYHRPACIICGDTLTTHKPDPGPILHACQLLKQEPKNCLYVGDAITDVMASKAAGTKALVALYGYIHPSEDPFSWGADGYVAQPFDIIKFLES